MNKLAMRRPVELYSSFTGHEGQITVSMWRYTSTSVSIRNSAMERAFPEMRKLDADDTSRQLMSTFAALFAHLKSITFNVSDAAPDWIIQFEWWWANCEEWFEKGEYHKMWDLAGDIDFQQIILFMLDAFKATRRDELPKTPELATGAAKTGDADFLSGESGSSESSPAG